MILHDADTVLYLNGQYHSNCMMERNRFLVDNSNVLLAIYDSECPGGTAATIRYAHTTGKALVVINPITQEVFRGFDISYPR